MTPEQKDDIRLLIAIYDENGWDWSIALEYEVRKYNGSLPEQERWPWGNNERRRHARRNGGANTEAGNESGKPEADTY